eukprot:6200399-Pleurochrysis_carterae.AAC.2
MVCMISYGSSTCTLNLYLDAGRCLCWSGKRLLLSRHRIEGQYKYEHMLSKITTSRILVLPGHARTPYQDYRAV